jgi:hypothetical protein
VGVRYLEEVAALCCDFWNGADSLLITIGEDGSLFPTNLDLFLDIGHVETVFVHERVDESRRGLLADRFGGERISQMWARDGPPRTTSAEPSANVPRADGRRAAACIADPRL